jgi:hypothetical protein
MAEAEALALAIQTLELKARCSHCGNECAELKRCSVCKHVSYCGAACQNAAWKKHKKICVTIEEVVRRMGAAFEGQDWRGVLKWEGRLEQLLEGQSDNAREFRLSIFRWAHTLAWERDEKGSIEHALAAFRLQDRRIELLGNMERFRDQGEAMCGAADCLRMADEDTKAAGYLQRARDVGAAHGFFSVECKACDGLGQMAMFEGRHVEGIELLRNALAASLLHDDDTRLELEALAQLTRALLKIDAIDEVEPLVPRFREAAEAQSRKDGCVSLWDELDVLYASARLHEVGTPFTPRRPCFRQGR